MRAVTITIFLLISINVLSGCGPCGHPVGCAVAPVAYAVAIPVSAAKGAIKDSLNEDRAQRASKAARAGDEIWLSEILEAQSEISASQQADEATSYQASVGAAYRSPTKSGARASTSQLEVLKVALLPFATGANACSRVEQDLKDFSNTFVQSSPNADLIYSYYESGDFGNVTIDPALLWDGMVQKVPNRGKLLSTGRQLNADVALTFFQKKRTAGWYECDMYSVTVYLVDVAHDRVYTGKGDERNYRHVTAQLFDELKIEHGNSGISTVATPK